MKFIAGTALGVAVALLIAFNVLLVWVASGPRSLDAITPFIEASISGKESNFTVNIGETWLIWDGWKHPIDIRLKNVSVLTKSRQRFSRFPEISVGLDIPELLVGNILPSSLSITHPIISLYQKEDRSISFGFKPEADPDVPGSGELPEDLKTAEPPADMLPEAEPLPFTVVLAQLLEPPADSPLRKLRHVTILDADISVGNYEKGVFFQAGDANLMFKKNRRGLQLFGSAKMHYGEHESVVEANFLMPHGSTIMEGEATFGEIMPGKLSDLFVHKNEISGLKFPVRGKVTLAVERNNGLQSLGVSLDGGAGSIEHERLEAPVPIQGMHVEARLSGDDLEVQRFHLQLEGEAAIDASARVSLKPGQVGVQGQSHVVHIPCDDLHRYWPVGVAPESREWVVTNIRGGEYAEAKTIFNIKPGDLELESLPREAVDATVTVKDARIQYLPGHPETTQVNAGMHIDGVSLKADIYSAQHLKSTRLQNGQLTIDDLNVDNPYITIAFDAETTGRDLVKFLSLPRLEHTQRLKLNEDAAEGEIKGHASVGFHFEAPKENPDDDITFEVNGEVKGVAQPKFLGKFDISQAAGSISVNNQRITFKGSGEVNGAKAQEASVTYLFEPEEGFDTFIDTSAVAPVASLPSFGYPKLDFLEGALGVKASLKLGDNRERGKATIDLTAASINLKPARFKKAMNEPATLEFTREKEGNNSAIPSFHIKGKQLDGQGDATVAPNMGELSRITFTSLIYGRNNLSSLRYEPIPGGFRLFLRGKMADGSPWFESKPGEEGEFSFKNFPAVDVDMQVGQLLLGEGRELSGVKGTVNCDMQRCTGIDMQGATSDGKPFNFRLLKNPKGKRQVSLRAESAGAFLKAVGVFDSMEGGDLSLTGTFTDGPQGSELKGRIDGTAYTVKNAPVLAKMLSLASLTGFFDTLSGKGIAFNKLRAPFTLAGDVLTFRDAKTFGDAMGMTAEGTITFPKQVMDLKGTIVPSYSVNTVLGKVPLIGQALVGGEGKGVFAASYTITGHGNDPEVRVNPLSILTPGFLRGLFDIFDKPADKDDE